MNKVDGVSRKFKRVSPFVNFPALGVKCSISIMYSTNADELSCYNNQVCTLRIIKQEYIPDGCCIRVLFEHNFSKAV